MDAVKEDLRSTEENLDKMYEKEIVDEKMEEVKQTLRSMEDTLEDRTEHLKEHMCPLEVSPQVFKPARRSPVVFLMGQIANIRSY